MYKELERRLYEMKADITPNKVIEIAENIYQIKAKIPNSNKTIKKILLLTEEQKYLAKLFGF